MLTVVGGSKVSSVFTFNHFQTGVSGILLNSFSLMPLFSHISMLLSTFSSIFFFFSWEYSTGKITIMTFTLKMQDESDWNWWLISGLQDFTQIYQAAFKLPWNLWAWTKLHTRMVKKAAERTLIKFFFLALCQSNASFFFRTQFQMESNHYEMKLHFQISSFSVNVSQLCWQNVFSPFLWPLKTLFQNIS